MAKSKQKYWVVQVGPHGGFLAGLKTSKKKLDMRVDSWEIFYGGIDQGDAPLVFMNGDHAATWAAMGNLTGLECSVYRLSDDEITTLVSRAIGAPKAPKTKAAPKSKPKSKVPKNPIKGDTPPVAEEQEGSTNEPT